MVDGRYTHNSGKLNYFNSLSKTDPSPSSPYTINYSPSDIEEDNSYHQDSYHQEPMVFQHQHHHQLQQQQNQHQHQHQQQRQQQQQNQHQLQHQRQCHNGLQKMQLQQQQIPMHQHQQHLLHQQQQRQSQMTQDFRASGTGQIKGYIDPNRFHQRQQEQQQLQLKLQQQLQQGEHIQQQQAQMQSFHLQRALPNHQQRQLTPGNFGSMAELRQRQHQLLATAASCNPSIWGVHPPGVASRHQHLLEKERTSRDDNGTASKKGSVNIIPGAIANPGTSNWNTSNNKTGSKQKIRSEKKRDQEKQRRSDLNEKFAALIHVVKRLETEDEEVERKRTIMEESRRKRKERGSEERKEYLDFENTMRGEGNEEDTGSFNSSISSSESSRKKQKVDIGSLAISETFEMMSAERRDFKRRFPCFISPSNRSDLIARAVSHLMKYSKIRNKLNEDLDKLRKKVEDVRRGNVESEQSLYDIEGAGMVATPSMNSMIVSVGDNNKDTDSTETPLATGGTDKASRPSSTIVAKNGMQQPQQQQQQQPQMMMMMPMMMNPNGSFNQMPQQFMPMPMPSMGAHLFNNMMVMPQLSQAAPTPTAEQQVFQLGRQQGQGGIQNEQEQKLHPQEDSAGEDGKPFARETQFVNVSDDSAREATSTSPTASGAPNSPLCSSPPSPVSSNGAKVPIDTGGTNPCIESKSNLPTDSSTSLNDTKQKSLNAELPEEKLVEPPSTNLVNHASTNTVSKAVPPSEEPLQNPSSNDIVPTEEKGTPSAPGASGTETTSCSNGDDATKNLSNKTTSKVSSPVIPLLKLDSPMSPATNLPNTEEKIFPSPATPLLETGLNQEDMEMADVTRFEKPSQKDKAPRAPLAAKANDEVVFEKETAPQNPSPAKVNDEVVSEKETVSQSPSPAKANDEVVSEKETTPQSPSSSNANDEVVSEKETAPRAPSPVKANDEVVSEKETTPQSHSPANANDKVVVETKEPEPIKEERQTNIQNAVMEERLTKKGQRMSQTTESLASTLLGLSRSHVSTDSPTSPVNRAA